jgi:hypothetical protein
MAQQLLQTRDIEIFRALARLEYLTTRELGNTFFLTPRRARRRLQRLSELNYIAPHRKGLDPLSTYSAWRLTERGVAELMGAVPSEPVPAGFVQRVAEGSLLHLYHREALAGLYLGLITFGVGAPADDNDVASIRARTAQLRGLAEQFDWQPDGAVVLRYALGSRQYHVVPDATVTSRVQPVRAFVELDRSNKPLQRIAKNLERYKLYCAGPYAQVWKDDRAAMVVYVVGHEARQAGVARLCERILGNHVRWDAVLLKDAVGALRTALLGLGQLDLAPAVDMRAPDDTNPTIDLLTASRKACSWMMRHFKELHRQGLHEFLDRSSIEEGVRRANVLYAELERAGVVHAG